jgi:zinc transport system substrate-binding protein
MVMVLLMPPARAAEPKVVASIKPLHSLVASVMGDTGTPALLVGGMQSPHDYQLKPSQVELMHHADIVFYVGPGLETFLTRTLADLPPPVRPSRLSGQSRWPTRRA